MSEHIVRTSWRASDAPFTYDTYERTHDVAFGTGTSMKVSAAAEYRGDPGVVNPEELLVSAASSCHMLTFLAIAARKRLVIVSYEDDAVGHLEQDEEKRTTVTRIVLRPRIVFEGRVPERAEMEKLHASAHTNCFIARALRSSVTVEYIDPIQVGAV